VREADADCDGYLNYWILQGRSEIIIYCCYISTLVDVDAIKQKDVTCWSMEKTGISTVRGAYNLALLLKNQNRVAGSSASNIRGDRVVWNRVWRGPVPRKVKFFTWKPGRDALPTKSNKHNRKMELDANCNLCGNGREDGYHDVVVCPLASISALRHAMRDYWDLPGESLFQYIGPDWFLLLLDRLSEEQQDSVKLLFWRAWQVYNNITHNSVQFLQKHTIQLCYKFNNTQLKRSSKVKSRVQYLTEKSGERNCDLCG
jgi:hypothetical protein